MNTRPSPRHAVVRTADGGWLLQPLDAACAPVGGSRRASTSADVAAQVARIEQACGPRWVWRSTAAWYRVLVEQAVRVARCHDVTHTERLLLGQEGRWAALSATSTQPEAERSQGEPDLFSQGPPPGPDVTGSPSRTPSRTARVSSRSWSPTTSTS